MRVICRFLVAVLLLLIPSIAFSEDLGLRVDWADNCLTISGERLPGRSMEILYLEAYCRPHAHDRDWHETVMGHRTELVSRRDDGKQVKLHCRVSDGVTVDHEIEAEADRVDFRLTFHNPSPQISELHWGQPCIRVNRFTGADKEDYIRKCFVFLDGKLTRLPTQPWATKARYVPGQVYRAPEVSPDDANPRPLSELIPNPGVIGCYSSDETMLMAVAFEPWHELFQGVAHCLHADFRVGGLAPGEMKTVHGKIWFLPADEQQLLDRVKQDFSRVKTPLINK